MRLRFGNKWGATREVHAGSGYWSQDAASQILATPEQPDEIQIRWPGGKITTNAVPSGAHAIVVNFEGGNVRAE